MPPSRPVELPAVTPPPVAAAALTPVAPVPVPTSPVTAAPIPGSPPVLAVTSTLRPLAPAVVPGAVAFALTFTAGFSVEPALVLAPATIPIKYLPGDPIDPPPVSPEPGTR